MKLVSQLIQIAGLSCLVYQTPAAVLPPDYLQCVVSIGVDELSSQPDGKTALRWVTQASGFLYRYDVPKKEGEEQFYAYYLVTNAHVLRGKSQVFVRMNSAAGDSTKYPIILTGESDRVLFLHPSVDLAVIQLNAPKLVADKLEFKTFTRDNLATREVISAAGLAVGDGVFVLGFPMGVAGEAKNYVVAKQGIIARLSSTPDPHKTTEYLIDALIFPGNSGGPVVTRIEAASITGTKSVMNSYLLGVVYQFLPYTDVAISAQTNRPRVSFEENSGLASVIPADYIEETIQMHRKREQSRAEAR
jgi:S1-C subfamily serine protease